MNVPPADGMRVAVDDLGSLVAQIFQKVPIPVEHAELIADLPVSYTHLTLPTNREV